MNFHRPNQQEVVQCLVAVGGEVVPTPTHKPWGDYKLIFDPTAIFVLLGKRLLVQVGIDKISNASVRDIAGKKYLQLATGYISEFKTQGI